MNDEPENEPEIIDLETMKDTPILKADELRLSVQLTEDELTERRDQQDVRWETMRELKDAEDARRKVFNKQHQSRETEFDTEQRILKAKAEWRQVEVKWYGLLDSNLCLKVRTDTSEVLDRRALEPKEIDKLSQQPLPLPGAEGDEPLAGSEAKPLPKGARDLAKIIKAGGADRALDALKADSRKSVEAAVKARREVLTASELPIEAGESSKNL